LAVLRRKEESMGDTGTTGSGNGHRVEADTGEDSPKAGGQPGMGTQPGREPEPTDMPEETPEEESRSTL